MARWYAMSTDFLADPKVETLGENHGPAGPLVIVALLARAKRQDDGGAVKASVRTLAHEAFTDRDTVARIAADAADAGLLNLDAESDREIIATFPKWNRWQDAGRKAREREVRKSEMSGPVRSASGPVRSASTTRQDRTDKTKQTEQNSIVGKPADSPLSALLADLIEKNTGRRPRPGKRWADAERLLFSRDDRDPAQAERLLRWCQNDEFWRSNILSMTKFREKYDQLLLTAKRAQGQKSKEPPGMANARRLAAEAERLEALERQAA